MIAVKCLVQQFCSTGLQQVKKRVVPHEAYNVVLPRCKAQWPVEYQREVKEERYQEQVPET